MAKKIINTGKIYIDGSFLKQKKPASQKDSRGLDRKFYEIDLGSDTLYTANGTLAESREVTVDVENSGELFFQNAEGTLKKTYTRFGDSVFSISPTFFTEATLASEPYTEYPTEGDVSVFGTMATQNAADNAFLGDGFISGNYSYIDKGSPVTAQILANRVIGGISDIDGDTLTETKYSKETSVDSSSQRVLDSEVWFKYAKTISTGDYTEYSQKNITKNSTEPTSVEITHSIGDLGRTSPNYTRVLKTGFVVNNDESTGDYYISDQETFDSIFDNGAGLLSTKRLFNQISVPAGQGYLSTSTNTYTLSDNSVNTNSVISSKPDVLSLSVTNGISGSIGSIDVRSNLLTLGFSAGANLEIKTLPIYADNAAALAGGLVTDYVYKTATGELRIVV